VSKHVKHIPKHRHAPTRSFARQAPTKALRSTLIFSSVAVAATGVAVSGGVLSAPGSISTAASGLSATAVKPLTADQVAERSSEVVSRSQDRREASDPAKEAALTQTEGPAITRTEDISQEDPRTIARALLAEFGFSQDQFSCLDSLYAGESGWRVDADNPSSSAYGIPQALPGSKMASAGADWATNPVTQIRWGLGYIRDRYGSPCGAMSFKSGHGWY
jgi:hypothetical protein